MKNLTYLVVGRSSDILSSMPVEITCHASSLSENWPRSGVSLAWRRQHGVTSEATGEHQEYIDVLSFHRQSLQNKQINICIPVYCVQYSHLEPLAALFLGQCDL